MMRQKSSARFRFDGAALLLIVLAFLLPALRDGDRRIYLLAAAVSVAMLLCVTLLARMFSLDRMILSLVLYLCAAGILALITDPDAAEMQALRSLAGTAFLLVGALAARGLAPSLLTACASGFLGLLLLSARLLVPSLSVDLTGPGLALLMVSLSALLSLYGAFPALAAGIAGLILLFLQQAALWEAIIWSLSFLLLLWAADSRPLAVFSGLAAVLLLFFGVFRVRPEDLVPAAVPDASGLSALLSAGLFGSDTPAEALLSLGTDSLFPRLAGYLGLIFAGLTAILFLPLTLRGVSIASCARKRYHAVLAMGAVLPIAFRALAALLSSFGIIPLPALALPLLTTSLPALCGQMFLIGILCGISGKNEDDLNDDAHLAMLAR